MGVGRQAHNWKWHLDRHQWFCVRREQIPKRASGRAYRFAEQGRKECILCLRAGESLGKRKNKSNAEVPHRQDRSQLHDAGVAEGGGGQWAIDISDCLNNNSSACRNLLLGRMIVSRLLWTLNIGHTYGHWTYIRATYLREHVHTCNRLKRSDHE